MKRKITTIALLIITTVCVQAQTILSESFSSFTPPLGWTETSVSPGDQWAFGGSLDFGPTALIDDPLGNSGEYTRVDMSTDPDTTALITPVVNITGIQNPEFSFYYISQFDETNFTAFTPFNRLIVDYWNGASWSNIIIIDTLTTSGWVKYTFDASGFTFGGNGDIQIQFAAQEGGAAIGGTGTATFNQDMTFDEVFITLLVYLRMYLQLRMAAILRLLLILQY